MKQFRVIILAPSACVESDVIIPNFLQMPIFFKFCEHVHAFDKKDTKIHSFCACKKVDETQRRSSKAAKLLKNFDFVKSVFLWAGMVAIELNTR